MCHVFFSELKWKKPSKQMGWISRPMNCEAVGKTCLLLQFTDKRWIFFWVMGTRENMPFLKLFYF